MDHAEARDIVNEAAPELTGAESLFLRAVAYHETSYGRGWREAGVGSHNWGAVTDPDCGPLHFEHRDSRPNDDGTQTEYVTCFKGYPNDEEGVRHLARVLLKDNVRRGIASGNLLNGTRAMRANAYFLGTKPDPEAATQDYARALRPIVDAIVAKTGERNHFTARRGRVLPALLALSAFGLAAVLSRGKLKRQWD